MAPFRKAVALAVSLLLVSAPTAAAACRNAGASTETATPRARHDLGALRRNRKLSTAARRHSRAMVREHFFSHDSPNGASLVDRIRATGYLEGAQSWSIGENIAYGSGRRSTPRSIGRAWMNSPGHRANILSRSFREIGIGIAAGTPVGGGGTTYTTDFGRRS